MTVALEEKKTMRDGGAVATAVDSLASTCNHAAHEFFVSTTCTHLVAPLTARGQGMDVYLKKRRLDSGGVSFLAQRIEA